MKRTILLCLLCALVLLSLPAQGKGKVYLGVNPVAAVSAFPTSINLYLSLLNGFETGLSLSLDWFVTDSAAVRLKFCAGPSDRLTWNWQIHAGAVFFPFEGNGFHYGATLKFTDQFKSSLHEPHFFHLVPCVLAGWRFDPDPYFVDLELIQTVSAVSWSSMPRSGIGAGWFFSPWSSFFPVLPVINMAVGRKI